MAHGPSPWPETTPKETWKFQLERWSSLIFSYQRCKSWVNLSEIDGFWLDASLATLPLVVYPLVNKHNYGKSPCLMENSLWMAIFNSYVSLPEGNYVWLTSFQPLVYQHPPRCQATSLLFSSGLGFREVGARMLQPQTTTTNYRNLWYYYR